MAVLMVYRCIDVRLPDVRQDHTRFAHSMSEQEVEDASRA
jgi:hypothetical protein